MLKEKERRKRRWLIFGNYFWCSRQWIAIGRRAFGISWLSIFFFFSIKRRRPEHTKSSFIIISHTFNPWNMEWNKLRRLFLNYFLISWHLFAFMIISRLCVSCAASSPVVLGGRKNQSLEKQTVIEAKSSSGRHKKGEKWWINLQIFEHWRVGRVWRFCKNANEIDQIRKLYRTINL